MQQTSEAKKRLESITLKLILEIKQPSDFQFEKVDLGHHRRI